jgi:hypothetical protein
MKLRRLYSPLIFVLLIIAASYTNLNAQGGVRSGPTDFYTMTPGGYRPLSWLPILIGPADPFENGTADTEVHIVNTPTDGGIREDVPKKYKARFDKWKAELLSTEFGRRQWETYADNKGFVLTIKVTGDKGKGAGTDKFQWDAAGNFVGATITLGAELDDGYPAPVYYPVLNSLATTGGSSYSISGRILAATKLSHEIGHVNQTAQANMKSLQLQSKLTPLYISIFLKNGSDTSDKKLVDLAEQMGGTPTEIWASREYWSEINAMLFLRERISKEIFYCHVFNKIKHNLKEYAGDYEQRFVQYPEYSDSPCWK